VPVRAYPFERLRRISRSDAAIESAAARWLGATALPPHGALAQLVGGPVVARMTGASATPDPHAAACEVRVAGAAFVVTCGSAAVRRLAQHALGGPDELPAPRALDDVERALFALAVAAALDDLGVAGEAWPRDGVSPAEDALALEFVLDARGAAATVVAYVPRALALRPSPRAGAFAARVQLDVPVVVARCALARAAVAAVAVRDVVTVERAAGDAELVLGDGAIGLHAARGSATATVATGYVRRDMSLPDDAHVELAVALGTTRLSLRQLAELAIGQIVPLGRPLAGPFELRADGRVVGRCELVDIDGELGVRVTSLGAE
jgi:hypothetical protein